MRRRPEWYLVIAIVLLFMAPLISGIVVQAEEKQRYMTKPEYKVGDYWEYEVTDQGNVYDERREVKEVSDKIKIEISADFTSGSDTTTIDGTIKREKSDLALSSKQYEITTNTNVSEYSWEYDPPLNIYKWNLEDHEEWTVVTTVNEYKKEDGVEDTNSSSKTFKVKVEDVEKETIKGQEYIIMQIKVESDGQITEIWYSSDAGNVVKEVKPSGYKRELKGFSCDKTGDIKEENGGGSGGLGDLFGGGLMCMAIPAIIGVLIGIFFGAIFGLYSGYSSEIDMPRRKKRKKKKKKAKKEGIIGPKFCPKHGLRTEIQEGVAVCHECEGSPMMSFKYCPIHGVKLRELDDVLLCDECSGTVKW